MIYFLIYLLMGTLFLGLSYLLVSDSFRQRLSNPLIMVLVILFWLPSIVTSMYQKKA